jgi:hypothetical protein
MAVKLNERGYAHARKLVTEHKATVDDRDAWSEHQPSADAENDYIEEHGWNAFGRWHLGLDDDKGEETKALYRFPYGDFETVHRCGVLAAESRAGQYGHTDVELAAAHLHGALDVLK